MLIKGVFSFVILHSLDAVSNGQTQNLLQNPNADLRTANWQTFGEASIEPCIGNDLCFVDRNGGHFFQDVTLPESSTGKFALLIGRASAERINPDGSITDLPYLYGYMMGPSATREETILAYLQGQGMGATTRVRNDWVTLWGIFEVPEKTRAIRFFLNQALRNGLPHNGSAARFDNVGLFLFSSRKDAEVFVSQY